MRVRLQTTLAFAALCCSFSPASWSADQQSFALVQRGKALADAADCVACHTGNPNKPFAGGRPIETPFGTIYSPNITPARETGIGAWSDADFYRAMHEGIGPDGTLLYPAFPYPYFTKMPRDDVLAVLAYLKTLQPIENTRPDNQLQWPLNHRVVMRGWNLLFFSPGTFAPNKDKSEEWNRGAYLVEGPGHCGACHTPKNAFGADKTGAQLQGGLIQDWFAPNITNDLRAGIGSWSVDDIVEYLKTGRNARSGAAALMSEVVMHSTSKMSESDLHAVAVYLKDVAGKFEPPPSKPAPAFAKAGKAIFLDSCAACHRSDGEGEPRMFPPLAKNANVQSSDPTTVIRVVLEGARTAVTDRRPTPSSMPPYDWKLSDIQIAAVVTYIRNAWGNSASSVSVDQVKALKENLRAATH
jgi:mono/diheme cytochrome c family protein